MNFIKKKIKGSKKSAAADDDDLDPNLFHLPHSREGAPSGWVPYDERIDEESEEWRAYRLLTQRVTETVQESKQNLSKIVATTALSENNRDIKPVTSAVAEEDSGDSQQPQHNGLQGSSVSAAAAAARAKPERPPPPSRQAQQPPPRPPLPGSVSPSTAVARPSGHAKPTTPSQPRSGQLEFGYKTATAARSSAAPASFSSGALPVSLFLDDDTILGGSYGRQDDKDDPFDTSFVNDTARHSAPPAAADLLFGNDAPPPATSVVGTIKGYISDDDLDAFGEHPSDEDDDPFIVKECVLTPLPPTMDPFDSFLLESSAGGRPDVRSPNPFHVDSQAAPVVSGRTSANPFINDDSDDMDDDPFGAQMVPNPFASMLAQSAGGGAAVDLFGFGAVASEDVGQKSHAGGDLFDLLGGGDSEDTPPATDFASVPMAAADGRAPNPFAASFAQSEGPLSPPLWSQQPHFDPFDMSGGDDDALPPAKVADALVDSILSFSSQHAKSSSAGGGGGDPFRSTLAEQLITNIPAAPSAENLFMLSENDDVDPFATDKTGAMVSDAQAREDGTAEAVVDVDEVTSDEEQDAPQIDFFGADYDIVNVSGVSVELSQVAPSHLDDYDEFFVLKTVETTAPTAEAATKATPASSGPPPRPPPPSKPVRPPPPNIAAPAAAPASEVAQSKPDSMWDAFAAETVARETVPAVDSRKASLMDDDPFGLVESDVGFSSEMHVTDAVKRHPVGFDAEPFGVSSRRASKPDKDPFEAFGTTTDGMVAPPATVDDFFGGFEQTSDRSRVMPSVETAVAARPPPQSDILDFFGGEQVSSVGASVLPTIRKLSSEQIDLLAKEPIVAADAPLSVLQEAGSPVMQPTVISVDVAAFDAFDVKFQSTTETSAGASDGFDPFGSSHGLAGALPRATAEEISQGFGAPDDFDQFFALKESPAAPKPSPARLPVKASKPEGDESDSDSDDNGGPDFSVFIRPKMKDKDEVSLNLGPIPVLAPPPKSPMRSPPSHTSPRFNPFDKEPGAAAGDAAFGEFADADSFAAAFGAPDVPRDLPGIEPATTAAAESPSSKEIPKIPAAVVAQESQESPGSPLFEADDSEPLEDFWPKHPSSEGWDLMLRQPSKKKLTGQRFWKKVYVTLSDNGVLHLYNKREDKDAFQELPLQACYSMTEVGAQQYDTYGKIFTVKLQYVFYRERVGVRPGQISKVAHGQITSLGQLAKLGLPLEHSPQVSQLLKLGTQTFKDLQEFIREVEDSLFRLTVHRDRALTYKTEEVQVTVVDELRAEVEINGIVLKQLARVRVFLLAFIVGMPDVELGLNDITKQGKEVVGRHDIIPVVTEEWIRLEKCEFHSCVMVKEFEKTRSIKFHPPDACFFEILRFRIRPPKNRELPLQVRPTLSIIGNRVEIRADVLVPGCISRKHGQIPCEDVAIRFPLPECWIYLFRVEKHFRYGSIKSAARKPGKIKGLERIMGAGLSMEPSMIEVSTGQAKYEHQHRAIVWRVPRLPKDGQGAYTTQLFVCRLELTSYDQIPPEFDHFIYVEFTMPATTVSHTTVRSVSLTNPNPPEKYVKYLARHKYRVEMEHLTTASECDYVAATSGGGGGTASANGSDAPSQ